MSGLLLGILLSRPVSSFVADFFGWRAVFGFGALTMTITMAVLFFTIPGRQPDHKASYFQLIRSLKELFVTMPVLRRRSLYQGLMFGAFSLFWTAVPVELMHHYGLSQSAIAVFALVGAMGATSAPFAGRIADAGHTHRPTAVALTLGATGFLPILLFPRLGLIGLVSTGMVLDFAVQMNMVLGQRDIYALHPPSRSRLNSIYVTTIFIGGASGSALAGPLLEHGGWPCISLAGALLPLIALTHFLASTRRRPAIV